MPGHTVDPHAGHNPITSNEPVTPVTIPVEAGSVVHGLERGEPETVRNPELEPRAPHHGGGDFRAKMTTKPGQPAAGERFTMQIDLEDARGRRIDPQEPFEPSAEELGADGIEIES